MKFSKPTQLCLIATFLAVAVLAVAAPMMTNAAVSPAAVAGGSGGGPDPGGAASGAGGGAPGAGGGPTDINNYLKNLYFWFLGVVGISALFAIVFGGVLYMFSGTSLTKVDQARHWISNAIFGILLAGGSYVLLKAINPDFTEHGFDLTNSINRLLPPPVRTTTAPASNSGVNTRAPASGGAVGPGAGGSLSGTGLTR